MPLPYQLFSQLSRWIRSYYSAPSSKAQTENPPVYREQDYFPVMPSMNDITKLTSNGCAIGLYIGSSIGALQSMTLFGMTAARSYTGQETTQTCLTPQCGLTVISFGAKEMGAVGALAGTSVALAAGIVQSFYQGVKYIFFGGLSVKESELLNNLATFVTHEQQLFELVHNFKLIRAFLQNDMIDCLLHSKQNAASVAFALHQIQSESLFVGPTVQRAKILRLLVANSENAKEISTNALFYARKFSTLIDAPQKYFLILFALGILGFIPFNFAREEFLFLCTQDMRYMNFQRQLFMSKSFEAIIQEIASGAKIYCFLKTEAPASIGADEFKMRIMN